jgi:hypothetical protein
VDPLNAVVCCVVSMSPELYFFVSISRKTFEFKVHTIRNWKMTYTKHGRIDNGLDGHRVYRLSVSGCRNISEIRETVIVTTKLDPVFAVFQVY